MSSDGKVTIGLPGELAEAVDRAVSAGEYASAADVVIDAVKLWNEGRVQHGLGDDELGRLWDAGIESGVGRYSSIDEVLEEAQRRMRSKS